MAIASLKTEKRTFTLNRAHKVLQRLVEVVTAEEQKIGRSYFRSVTLDATGARALEKCKLAAAADLETLHKVLAVQGLLGAARNAIAAANATAGVTELMGREKAVTNQIRTLTQELSGMATGEELEEFELLRDEFAQLQATHVEEAKAKNVAYTPLPARVANVRAVPRNVIQTLEALRAELMATKVRLTDEISDANSTKVELELPSEYLPLLGCA